MSFDTSVLVTGLPSSLMTSLGSLAPIVLVVAGLVVAWYISGIVLDFLGSLRGFVADIRGVRALRSRLPEIARRNPDYHRELVSAMRQNPYRSWWQRAIYRRVVRL